MKSGITQFDLDGAYASGSFVDMDIADVAAAARDSLKDTRDVSGIPREVAFSGLMNQWVDYNWQRTIQGILEYSGEAEAEYHAPSRRGAIRATGSSEADYDRAVADARNGDPSPLLMMRTTFLDTI